MNRFKHWLAALWGRRCDTLRNKVQCTKPAFHDGRHSYKESV